MVDSSRAKELGLSFGEQRDARLAQQARAEQIDTGVFDRSYMEWLRFWRTAGFHELDFLDPASIEEHLKLTYAHGIALLGVIQQDPVGVKLLKEYSIDRLPVQDQHAFRKKAVHLMAHPEDLLGPNAHQVIHFTQHVERYSPVERRKTIQAQLVPNQGLIQPNPNLWRSAIYHTMDYLDERNTNKRMAQARSMVDLVKHVASQTARQAILDSDPVSQREGMGDMDLLWITAAELASVEVAAYDSDQPDRFKAQVLPMFPNPREEQLTFAELLKELPPLPPPTPIKGFRRATPVRSF